MFLLCVIAGCASAQAVSIGVRGGVPITDFFNTVQGRQGSYATNTDRWTVGPTVALNLPLGFSVQLDALYRRLGWDYTQVTGGTVQTVSADSWQFPLLAKWAFLPGPVKPFVEGGASFQKISRLSQITAPARLVNDPTVGFTFGAGIQLKIHKVRIEPEFRYTRWGSEAFQDPLNSVLSTNRNQGDFLVGITF